MNRRSTVLILTLMMSILDLMAQDKVTFTASGPDAVAVGDQFKISFVVTSQNVRDFTAPSMAAFDVLYGPSRSQQSSVQIINGKTTSTGSITYSYTLLALKEGTFDIAGASIKADGETLLSNSLKINVLPQDQAGSGQNGATSSSSASATVSGNDLFITSSLNKTTVHEQEAVLLTYKIYSKVDLRGFDNVKLPDFKGFQAQEVELPNDRKWTLEHYNGSNYQTTTYRQFVLFPQQTGDLSIDPARFDASIAKVTQVVDPFEAFFNGGSGYVEVKKVLNTPRLTIHVESLSQGRPASFSGGVGEFTISSSISAQKLRTNDALTLRIVISGTGNHKLISVPEVEFPADFETYDAKVDNQTRLTVQGLSGNISYEYLAIPRSAGDFTIPPVTFSYFDTKAHQYRTLTTESYTVHVDKGEGDASQVVATFTGKEDVRLLNEDIRFINLGPSNLQSTDASFFGSMGYWLWYLVPLCLFTALYVQSFRQRRIQSDSMVLRKRKASRATARRLRKAGELMRQNQKDAFYDEVLRALYGYVSDKMSIPVSQLSKENIEENLRMRNVDSQIIEDFKNTLSECEFARFAPGDDALNMDHIYRMSMEVITRMEESIRKK